MVDVWFAHAHAVAPHALDDDEQARASRFLCPRAAATYRAAHTLARRVLSHYRPEVAPAAWRFGANTWGKPVVVPPLSAPGFNLSHSGDLLAIAVAGAEVGVDVERLRPMAHLDEVARHVFHPRELRWLARQPQALPAFFRLWTLKEALLKAAGTGFSHPAKLLCWQELDAPRPIAAFGGRAWVGATRAIDDDGAILSVAVPSGPGVEAHPPMLLRAQAAITGDLERLHPVAERFLRAAEPLAT
jgi:4'-phosphopantetheinyl transferase